MSPNSPTLKVLAEIPVARNVPAHSIIAVKDKFPVIQSGHDGVVQYKSAHVDYTQSELVVRSFHSCQDKPEAIEEVRRILHQHLDALPTMPGITNAPPTTIAGSGKDKPAPPAGVGAAPRNP